MKTEYHFHINGDADRIRDALNLLDGVIQTMTTQADGDIQITWKPSPKKNPQERVTELLNKGKSDDGILLLELLLSDDPDDGNILFNLGMAYSDAGELNHAIGHLRELTRIDPRHTHGWVALGVAFLRARNMDEGIGALQTAVSQDPNDLWARKNLGAGLLQTERFAEAVEQFQNATTISPDDQAAWYGLAQALQHSGETLEADKAHIKTIELDEFSEIAELARKGRSKIAEQGFHTAAGNAPRMDAVMYCVGALEKFTAMSTDEVQRIGFEIALLGTRGIDVNNPETRYTLKNLPGEFSGLHLLSIQYVAFKKFAPEQNIGFDLSVEYKAALKLFKG